MKRIRRVRRRGVAFARVDLVEVWGEISAVERSRRERRGVVPRASNHDVHARRRVQDTAHGHRRGVAVHPPRALNEIPSPDRPRGVLEDGLLMFPVLVVQPERRRRGRPPDVQVRLFHPFPPPASDGMHSHARGVSRDL
eukprot:30828-Pelagococcus_subviridis.AAC.6